jgi:membrane protease YdiL (CAAX protease family)
MKGEFGSIAKTKLFAKMVNTLMVVGTATILLVASTALIGGITLQIHPNSFVNNLAKYQLFALIVGLFVTVAILILNPESKQFLRIGQLNMVAEREKWLGISGKSSWKSNGLQLMFFVSMATAIFMTLAVKYTNSLGNFQWWFVPLVVLFSLTNSLAEELIFRFGIVGGLFSHYPKLTILIISALIFGMPHYFGWPRGILGVIMAGALGYILCKATIETKGLGIAWAIHFVQDVIIFSALLMMNVRK